MKLVVFTLNNLHYSLPLLPPAQAASLVNVTKGKMITYIVTVDTKKQMQS